MNNTSNLNWKTIPGFPNYAITPDGQIWSYNRNRFLKLTEDKDKYLRVNLSNDRGMTNWSVHRLVGMAFVKLPPEFNSDYDMATINHKDHNRQNNHYSNLEWVTASHNSQEAWDNGYLDHLKKPSFCVSIEDKKYTDFDSAIDMARSLNLPRSTVYQAINNANGILQGKYIVGHVEDFDWSYLLPTPGIDAFIQTYSDSIANYTPSKTECFLIDSLYNTYRPFDSCMSIDRYLNLSIGTTSRAIDRYNGLIQGRYIAGATDDPRWKGVPANPTIAQIVESYADQIKNYKPVNRGPRKITNLKTGESETYDSLSDFAREQGLDPRNIGRYLENHSDLYRVELA